MDVEHPDNIQFDALIEEVKRTKRLMEMEEVEDGEEEGRRGVFNLFGFRKRKNRILFVEGYLVFSNPELAALFDFSFFVFCNRKLCGERRLTRNLHKNDVPTISEKEREIVTEFYDEVVWPSFLKYNFNVLVELKKKGISLEEQEDLHHGNGEGSKVNEEQLERQEGRFLFLNGETDIQQLAQSAVNFLCQNIRV
eukprot:TRINITY_DN1913_c0_g1_i1.p1 TRINITY_DN1913_c0_g1~~TRINITY_DN1913_c0_g1_i1.p1  ORF type:complete len:195 (-),score=58.70 TRINITY_DN1913_c0_g1_i1:382-966(-)